MTASADLFRLEGKVALVTGASRGLGAAMAVALASAGATLVLHGSEKPPRATEAAIAESIGSSTALLVANLANRQETDRLIPDPIGPDRVRILRRRTPAAR